MIHVPKESFDAYSIVIILMGFLICFFTEGALTNFGKLLTEISLQFNKSRSQISMIGSTFTGVHFTVGPFSSALINAIGFRKSGVIGAIVASFGLFLASTSTEFVQLLISHAIAGFGTGTMSAVGNICIGYYFDKYRPMAVGIATAGTGFGTFFIAPLVHLIVDENKPRHWNKFMLCESLVLLCFVFICLLASKPKKMTLKAAKAEESKPNWLQKVFTPETVTPKPEEATQDESEDEADMEFSRKPSYPASELEKIVTFGPTLAEMYKIHSPPPELENIVKKSPKQKFSILKWRHTNKHKNIMKPKLLDTEDILYDQSSKAIANRRSIDLQLPAAKSNLEKRLLMIHAPNKVNERSRCKRIRALTVQTFLKIFDLSLFKTWTFCVAYMAVLCYSLALFIPYSFITGEKLNLKFQPFTNLLNRSSNRQWDAQRQSDAANLDNWSRKHRFTHHHWHNSHLLSGASGLKIHRFCVDICWNCSDCHCLLPSSSVSLPSDLLRLFCVWKWFVDFLFLNLFFISVVSKDRSKWKEIY